MTPDQLDIQSALARNEIRRQTNDARRRLNLPPVHYPTALPTDQETPT